MLPLPRSEWKTSSYQANLHRGDGWGQNLMPGVRGFPKPDSKGSWGLWPNCTVPCTRTIELGPTILFVIRRIGVCCLGFGILGQRDVRTWKCFGSEALPADRERGVLKPGLTTF